MSQQMVDIIDAFHRQHEAIEELREVVCALWAANADPAELTAA
jgi:hypothetical protein